MSAETPELLIGAAADGFYVNVQGRATQRTCPTVARVVSDYLAARPSEPRVLLDLSGCEWVDSTFAGWMVGLNKRVRRASGELRLTGCSEECWQSLEKMHLGRLFQTIDARPSVQTRVIPCEPQNRSSTDQIRLMLRAHEELASLGEANRSVFGPIVDMLRRELHK